METLNTMMMADVWYGECTRMRNMCYQICGSQRNIKKKPFLQRKTFPRYSGNFEQIKQQTAWTILIADCTILRRSCLFLCSVETNFLALKNIENLNGSHYKFHYDTIRKWKLLFSKIMVSELIHCTHSTHSTLHLRKQKDSKNCKNYGAGTICQSTIWNWQ